MYSGTLVCTAAGYIRFHSGVQLIHSANLQNGSIFSRSQISVRLSKKSQLPTDESQTTDEEPEIDGTQLLNKMLLKKSA